MVRNKSWVLWGRKVQRAGLKAAWEATGGGWVGVPSSSFCWGGC